MTRVTSAPAHALPAAGRTPSGTRITIPRGRDLHLHVRDGAVMRAVLPFTARTFDGAVIMPNTDPVIATVEDAARYRDDILEALDAQGPDPFVPMMTLYLTDDTTPDMVAEAAESGFVSGAKYYPPHGTTNAEAAASSVDHLWPVFAALERTGLVLSIHGEEMAEDVEVLDREARFIDRHLVRILRDFPALHIVLEHATTEAAVDFVRAAPQTVAATVTPQHLLYTLDDLLGGALRADLFCKPVVKFRRDRAALLAAVISGDPKFFAGTDSAPHTHAAKACGAAGCFTAPAALELYAEAFDARLDLGTEGSRQAFARFVAEAGAEFYGFPLTGRTVALEKTPVAPPGPVALPGQEGHLRPLGGRVRSGMLAWRVVPETG